MKRTLTISLWFALGVAALAQNPVTVRNNAQAVVKTSSQASVNAKPAPTSVKVVPVPVKKTTVAVKPVVVAKPVPQTKPAVVIKSAPVQVKPAAVAVKSAGQPKPSVVAVQPVQNKTAVQAKPAVAPGKPVAVAVPAVHAKIQAAPVPAKVVAVAKTDSHKPGKQPLVAVKASPDTKVVNIGKSEEKKPEAAPEQKSVAQNGRRDPFVSPIVTMSSVGSGCNSGKRCLAIDQINLKGIVKSDTGMIAVVVNAAEKAYFLRENDPVFNGYVVKITVDSIMFKETFHDKLGKPLTRDVTKTISRPVA